MEKRSGDFWWKWRAKCHYAHILLTFTSFITAGLWKISCQ